MTDTRISIIVPVYKVEEYLPRCLDSILSQTYENLELILVDDGSPDGCGAICDACGEKDSRVMVIHQENGGVARARNAGLAAATGEYLLFIDADDFVTADYVENMVGLIEKNEADIGVCGWVDVRGEKAEAASGRSAREPEQNAGIYGRNVWSAAPAARAFMNPQETICWSREEALKALLYQIPIDNALWAKIFRRKLFDGIFMPEGKIYEDFACAYRLLGRAERVAYNPWQGYRYFLRNQGIMRSSFTEKKMDLIDFAEEMRDYLLPRYPQLAPAVWSRFFRANCHIYLQIPAGKAFKACRKRVEANIRLSRGKVLRDKHARRGSRAAALVTYMGFWAFRALQRWKDAGKV